MKKKVETKNNSLRNYFAVMIPVMMLLASGNANADLFGQLSSLWEDFKSTILPIVVGVLFLGGGALVAMGESKIVKGLGVILVGLAIAIYGPELFGFRQSR